MQNKQVELQKLVEKISLEYFNYPYTGKVKINPRFTTTGGRYHLQNQMIELNSHFLTPDRQDDLIGIIKHELCHYYLHMHHLGYRHRDFDFKFWLRKVGGSRYTPDIGLRKKRKFKYLYVCQNCQQSYYRQRKINLRRFVCGKCRGRLFLVKKDLH